MILSPKHLVVNIERNCSIGGGGVRGLVRTGLCDAGSFDYMYRQQALGLCLMWRRRGAKFVAAVWCAGVRLLLQVRVVRRLWVTVRVVRSVCGLCA